MRRIALPLALALPTALVAQDQTILVLDGSGSMWGQIDGVAKIEIARDVLGELVGVVPPDQALGLTVYGHRSRGDCADIEMLVAPAPGTGPAITSAAQGVTPRGKTPLTAAVQQAAQAMRYTEERATVILVSDGRETCEADPCAVGAELEAAGIDFTAHVVGFDITDEADRAQLQCLANATGGLYRDAADAGELSSVLTEITEAPSLYAIDFVAVEGDDGPQVNEPLLWDVLRDDGTMVASGERGAVISLDLAAGSYTAEALRPSTEDYASATVDVTQDGQTVVVVFPSPLPPATVTGPVTAVQGDTIPVFYDGPANDLDYVSVGRVGEDGYVNWSYVPTGEQAGEVDLLMPAEPGQYELRYQLHEGGTILTRVPLTVTAAPVTIDAPATAIAGQTVQIGWSGPDYAQDYISIGLPGVEDYVTWTYTAEGAPLGLTMPTEPGTYEVRYQLHQDGVILGRQPIEVLAVGAALDVADARPAGSVLLVRWEGPNYDRDFIGLYEVDDPADAASISWFYTSDRSPAVIRMAAEPGTYELRYVTEGDERVVLARKAITLTPVSIAIDAPSEVIAGAPFAIRFDGPRYEGDYFAIRREGEDRNDTWSYARETPMVMVAPELPGRYRLSYHASKDDTVMGAMDLLVSPPPLD